MEGVQIIIELGIDGSFRIDLGSLQPLTAIGVLEFAKQAILTDDNRVVNEDESEEVYINEEERNVGEE